MLTGCMGFIHKARCYFGSSWAEFQGDEEQYIMLKQKATHFPNGRDCFPKGGNFNDACLTRNSKKFNSLCVLGSVELILVPCDPMAGAGVWGALICMYRTQICAWDCF